MIEKPPIKKPIMVRGIFENNPRNPIKMGGLTLVQDDTAPRKRHKVIRTTDDVKDRANQPIIVVNPDPRPCSQLPQQSDKPASA